VFAINNLKVMSDFYLYHGRQAKRGPNETCSLLLEYITNHVSETVEELQLFPTAILAKRETTLLSDSLQR
jgi:hypothetical protein